MNEKKKAAPAPAYRAKMRADRADALYLRIRGHLTDGKRYRDPAYTAARLAAELGTNTRYISAAVAVCTGGNYNALVNSLRLRDACQMLRSAKYARLNVEEIGLLAGFSSRQAFYLAFHRMYDCTPREYRQLS